MTYFFETASNVPQCMFISFVNHPIPFSIVRAVMNREGCTKVEIWGEAGDAWIEEPGMIVKDDNVPALAVYGDDLDPEQVDWQFNDKWVANEDPLKRFGADVFPFFAGTWLAK